MTFRRTLFASLFLSMLVGCAGEVDAPDAPDPSEEAEDSKAANDEVEGEKLGTTSSALTCLNRCYLMRGNYYCFRFCK